MITSRQSHQKRATKYAALHHTACEYRQLNLLILKDYHKLGHHIGQHEERYHEPHRQDGRWIRQSPPHPPTNLHTPFEFLCHQAERVVQHSASFSHLQHLHRER